MEPSYRLFRPALIPEKVMGAIQDILLSSIGYNGEVSLRPIRGMGATVLKQKALIRAWEHHSRIRTMSDKSLKNRLAQALPESAKYPIEAPVVEIMRFLPTPNQVHLAATLDAPTVFEEISAAINCLDKLAGISSMRCSEVPHVSFATFNPSYGNRLPENKIERIAKLIGGTILLGPVDYFSVARKKHPQLYNIHHARY